MQGRAIHQVLEKLVNGVYLLTCCRGEEINGMPVSWVSQVSSQPPLVMAAVRPDRYSHAMVEESGVFALILLGREQRNLVDRFMLKGAFKAEKFKDLALKEGNTGCPVLLGAAGFLECQVTSSQRPGDHTLFIGEVIEAGWHKDVSLLTIPDYGHTYGG
jgi:flavin reductase (DIM6/NTAB) family NADH-FMN oxidoreductase RutF